MSVADRKTVGRFAPTPSGKMHLGNIFCAMIAYLSAKKNGGEFLLRIEDLDAARCPKENAAAVIRDLETFGFEFDGEIIYQSRRTDVYKEFENRLAKLGLVYPCFCSRAELHASEAPHIGDGVYVYDGRCSLLSEEERREKAKKKKPCLRVRVPDSETVFEDKFKGRYAQNIKKECGDFIIRRSDGVYAYQLAVVADDALSGVSEVVRGEDLISSAPRQLWLCEVLGLEKPAYAHIPLVTGAGGRRLSKREGDGDTLAEVMSRKSPKEITGELAFASGLIDKYEPVSLAELVPLFDFDKIKKTHIAVDL